MSDRKSKNFSFRAVVFTSNKLVSLFATTMLLLLADGGINNSATARSAGLALDPAPLSVSATTLTAPAAQQNNTSSIQRTNSTGNSANASCASMDCVTGTLRTEPQPTKTTEVSNSSGTLPTNSSNTLINFVVTLVIQTEYAANGNSNLTQAQITQLYNAGVNPQQMYELIVTPGFADSNTFYAASCAVFWCSFAPSPPTQTQQASTAQQTSVQQDILSTGNSPTQVSIPIAACSFLFNNQNVCTEQNVTTATGIISVAVLGGIIAGVLTAVNNQANSNEQRQKDNDLLLQLYLLRDKSSGVRICYDSAQPPNPIPCP